MTRRPAFTAAVGSVVLLVAAGAVAAAGHGAATPPGHATHQIEDSSRMQGAGMDHSSHQMKDGSRMQGAGMDHSSHQMKATGATERPKALVLGGFALANVIVLAAAAAVRRRDGRRPGRTPAAAEGGR